MKVALRAAGLAALAGLTMTLLLGAKTRIVSKWMNPKAGAVDVASQSVAAFVVTLEPSMRLGPEETLAEELRSRGVDAVAGYTVLPRELEQDEQKSKEFMQQSGITAAVIMRVLSNQDETTYVPGTWYTAPYYSSFWGYWHHSWALAYDPGYLKTDRVVSIETLIFSIEKDLLIWAGRSSTTNPKNIKKFAKQLVSEIGKEMRKAGLVPK